MVGSINPVVHGDAKRGSWLLSVALYTAASALTAAVFGLLLALVGTPLRGRLPAHAGLGLAAALALGYGAHELGMVRLPAPQRRRQVPSGWRVRFSPWATALLYGAFLGPGVMTYVFTASYYVLLALAALHLRPLEAFTVMAVYGAAKGVSILVAGWPIDSADAAFRVGTGLLRSRDAAHRANGAALAGAAVLLGALLIA